jgi:hypothetical protein
MVKKKFRNIKDNTINVHCVARDPYIPFDDEEDQEIQNLVRAGYLECVGEANEKAADTK